MILFDLSCAVHLCYFFLYRICGAYADVNSKRRGNKLYIIKQTIGRTMLRG